MSMEWSANLSTGIDWQDRHHKELFKRINRLLDAMTIGCGKNEVGELFKFLDEYVIYHFEAEEDAMSKAGYPDAYAHSGEHTRFIEGLGRLRDEFRKGVSSGLVIKVQRQVVDWLLHHIGGPDKRLGGYLMETGGVGRNG